MIRLALATFTVSSLSLGSAFAQAPAVRAACQAAIPAPHLSFSAKSSTPIRGTANDALAPRRETKGSNAPKSSTPVGVTTPTEQPRTSGSMTPKGSTPVATAPGGTVACAQ